MSSVRETTHLIIPAMLPKIITVAAHQHQRGISVFFLAKILRPLTASVILLCQLDDGQYVEMFSSILTLSLMGFLLFKIIDSVENCRWMKIGKKDMMG